MVQEGFNSLDSLVVFSSTIPRLWLSKHLESLITAEHHNNDYKKKTSSAKQKSETENDKKGLVAGLGGKAFFFLVLLKLITFP